MATLGIATLETQVDLGGLGRGLADGERQTRGSLSKLAGSVTGLLGGVIKAGAIAAAGAVVGLGAALGKLTLDAAAIEGVRQTFANLAESVGGDAVPALEALSAATRGMVTDADLMRAGNKFFAMGLADSVEQAAELAEIATQLGMAMGEDATASMENFALMLANMSIPRMDSFGMSAGAARVRINELMEGTEGLTREQAFMQAVMEQAAITMEKVGEQGDTAQAGLDRVKTAFSNAGLAIGETFLPILKDLLDEYGPKLTAWLETATDWLGENMPAAIRAVEELLKGNLAGALSLVRGIIFRTFGAEGTAKFDEFVAKAHQIFDDIKMFVDEKFIPAFNDVKAWLEEKIPEAIAALKAVWEAELEQKFQDAQTFIENNLIPAIQDLAKWIEVNLPIAIAVLGEIWDGILKPAIEGLWMFLEDNLNPVLLALAGILLVNVIPGLVATAAAFVATALPVAALGLALIALGLLWKEYGRDVETTLDQLHLIIWYYLEKWALGAVDFGWKVGVAIGEMKDKVTSAFSAIGGAIQGAIDKVRDFLSELASAVIPDWMEGHSPPPMATWLNEIADAAMNVQIAAPGVLQPAGGPSTTYNFTANYRTTQAEVSLRDDVRMMQILAGAA